MADLDVQKSHHGEKVRTPPSTPKAVSTGSDAVSTLIAAQQPVNIAASTTWRESTSQVDGLSQRSNSQHSEWDSIDASGSRSISGNIREV